jgi:hypothetical protein
MINKYDFNINCIFFSCKYRFFLLKISANCNIKYDYDKKKVYNAVWLISLFVS